MNEFPTVPTEDAITLTANWRKYYSEIYNGPDTQLTISPDDENVFRGFRIPLEDLSQILDVIKNYNENAAHKNEPEINSVRAYLAKNSPDINIVKDVHVLLVPVVGGKKIEPHSKNKDIGEFGNDLLELETERGLSPKYTIYNFTTPCPTECDKTSKLFADQEKR